MRVAIVMKNYFGQRIGGAEYQAFLIAQSLIRLGHEVFYVFSDNGVSRRELIGCNLWVIKRNKIANKLNLEVPLHFRDIYRAIQSIEPDVVYCRGRSPFTTIMSLMASSKNLRMFWHLANDSDLYWPEFPKNPWGAISYGESRLFFKRMTAFKGIIAQTNFQARILEQKFGVEAQVIPNGLPTPERTQVQRVDGKIQVLWVANLKPKKQPSVVVEIARHFLQDKNVSFVMAGRPPQGRKPEELIKEIHMAENIQYLGEVTTDEVDRRMENSDIFINTSLNEGFPNTFIQAWMRRLPVVSLTVDPDDILKTQGIGFCSGSLEQMLIDLKRLVNDLSLRNSMGIKAQKYAYEKHSLKNIHKIALSISE